MMKLPQVPQDDVIDVMEMTNRIEKYILKVLKDHENNVAVSALISASINCLWMQCRTMDEVIFYRNMLVQVLDNSIQHMKIIGPDKPLS